MYPEDADVIALARTLYGLPDAVTDAFLTAWLPLAQGYVDIGTFGDHTAMALAMVIADKAQRSPAMNGGQAFGGRTQSVSTGGASVSFGFSVVGTNWSETSAGRDFEELRDSLAFSIPFAVGEC